MVTHEMHCSAISLFPLLTFVKVDVESIKEQEKPERLESIQVLSRHFSITQFKSREISQ